MQLDKFRETRSESYDEVISKLIYVVNLCKKNPELSKDALEQIEKARKRFSQGLFVSEKEAKKRLGL